MHGGVPVPTGNVQEGLRNLEEFGYTIHPGFLAPDQTRALRERLVEQAELELEAGVASFGSGIADAHALAGPPRDAALPPFQLVQFTPNKGRAFIDLLMHPTSLEYCRGIYGEIPFSLTIQVGSIVRPGASEMAIHTDQQLWPFPTPIPMMVAVMACLSDFEADGATTILMPGSHRRTDVPPWAGLTPEDSNCAVWAEAKAGSAIIWESRTWHGRAAAPPDRVRYSVGSMYAMHLQKPQDFYPAIIHDDVYATLSREEKQMLGFEATPYFGSRIGPRHAHDTRRNTNACYAYIPELRRGSGRSAVAVPDLHGPASLDGPRRVF